MREAGATGPIVFRFDSGYWSWALVAMLERLDVGYTMGVRMAKSVRAAVSEIPESVWTAIDYPQGGEAQVACCSYRGRRLICRRTRLVGAQAEMWPNWMRIPAIPYTQSGVFVHRCRRPRSGRRLSLGFSPSVHLLRATGS